jgi:pimeloyl-ACP methyl ester carboxylesterase
MSTMLRCNRAGISRRAGLSVAILAAHLSVGCSTTLGRSPAPLADDSVLDSHGLGPCIEEQSGRLRIDPARPLVLLVHGCRASAGNFRLLAQVFEAHGQQAACFSYDDRDSLEVSSAQLRSAIEVLASYLRAKALVVLGHSQGGLIARRALIRERDDRPVRAGELDLRLVTISSPFGRIAAAKHCGWLPLHVASFGMSAFICQLAAGDKWMEIHPVSRLVERPGTLVPEVRSFLRIMTDERETCFERDSAGACTKSDYVFSLSEQENPNMEKDPRLKSEVISAGHSGVVGQNGIPPLELIRVLQEDGVMTRTPEDRRVAIGRLLAKLY